MKLLVAKSASLQRTQTEKVIACHSLLKRAIDAAGGDAAAAEAGALTAGVTAAIDAYFGDEPGDAFVMERGLHAELRSKDSGYIRADVATLLRDENLPSPATALMLARILHAIGTLRCPAAEWRVSAFWGRYSKHCFEDVCAAVTEALVQIKTTLRKRTAGVAFTRNGLASSADDGLHGFQK